MGKGETVVVLPNSFKLRMIYIKLKILTDGLWVQRFIIKREKALIKI